MRIGDACNALGLLQAQAEEIAAAETAIDTEDLMHKAISQGVHPQEAYIKYGKF